MKLQKGTGDGTDNGGEYPILKTFTKLADKTVCPKEKLQSWQSWLL